MLEFSLCIVNDIENDLTFFQAERPLAIFLQERLHSLMLNIMNRFVRPEVMEANATTKKMMVINLTEGEDLMPVSSVNVGFGARKILKKLGTVHAIEIRKFYNNARQLLITLIRKLRERCPLKYALCMSISSFSPTQIANAEKKTLVKNFDNLLDHLVSKEWISSVSADRCQAQYLQMLNNTDFVKKCSVFNMFESRLDDFYMDALDPLHIDLISVVKLCLILSHGNAVKMFQMCIRFITSKQNQV